MKQKPIVRALAAAGLATVLGIGGIKYYEPISAHARAIEATPTAAPQAPLASLPDFSRLVDRYGPAVVNISVTGAAKAAAAAPDVGLSPDDPFYDFFKRFQVPQPEGPTHAIGSGFIISPDGLILTNAHVVQDASEVTVKLTDRREFTAKVVGADPATDVAVLKIDAKNLPTVKLGDAKHVRVGEWVVAIGSPYGFENSVTSGIVSAKARALPEGSSVPFIQTDVAVNPGNSGGPLFNLNGEVIGINAQIYSRTGGYQGLSFAIPIDTALQVKDQIVQNGTVHHGRLGVTIQEVNQALAKSFGLPKAGGALVSAVEPGSPADKAGLKSGDVVMKVDGADVTTSIDLSSRISATKPGSKAQLEVWRDGKPRDIVATVGEMPTKKLAAAAPMELSHAKIGVAVRGLTDEERKEAHVDNGLVVEEVGGAAAKAGIRPGDIILSANGTPLKSADQLKAAAQHAGKTMALLVQRNDVRIFVPVEIG